MEGAAGASGTSFDRAHIDRLLSSLGKRQFLLHNVHEKEPIVFETRWTMSYLRGPLGRDEIKKLTLPTVPGFRGSAVPKLSGTTQNPTSGTPEPRNPR